MIGREIVGRVALFASVFAATGCGNSVSASTTPSAPSSFGGAGATIMGSVAGSSAFSSGVRKESADFTITITGTSIAAAVSPGGSFMLTGVPSGDVELRISGPAMDSRVTIVAVSTGEVIHIVVSLNGSQAVMTITDRERPDRTVELEGLIVSINPNARTMVVGTRMVSVPVDAVIRHGNTSLVLTGLKAGDRVHVRGVLNGDVLVASEVKLQNPGDD